MARDEGGHDGAGLGASEGERASFVQSRAAACLAQPSADQSAQRYLVYVPDVHAVASSGCEDVSSGGAAGVRMPRAAVTRLR